MRPIDYLTDDSWESLPRWPQRSDQPDSPWTLPKDELKFETTVQTETLRVELFGYRSLAQLRQALEQTERSALDPAATRGPRSHRCDSSRAELASGPRSHRCDSSRAEELTVVLILDERFCGHLPSLIARRREGLRLVLASTSGRLPGLSTIGDLAAASGALGWRQITFSRSPEQAVADVAMSMTDGERAVIFYPDWNPPPPALPAASQSARPANSPKTP